MKWTDFRWSNFLRSHSITLGTTTQNGSFSYDGDGRQFTGTRNSVTTKYVYDGLNILYDLSGSTVKARYITELELDDMIAKKESGQTEYYHSDGLGSVVMMTTTSGNWTKRYRYDAWGNERVVEGTSSNTYTYTSRRKETDLGLLYYRARYYDPLIGRFISQDPFSGGPDDARISYENKMTSRLNGEFTQYNSFRDPHTFNRYVYVKNNPIRYIDPLGLRTVIVHGTWSKGEWARKGTPFNKAVSKTYGEQAEVFEWSGENSDKARRSAAAQLAAKYSNLEKDEKLNVVGYSHGGNVSLLATEKGLKIDRLTTIATPVRSSYKGNSKNIGKHFNVFSPYDDVQTLGGSLNRTFPTATNIEVNINQGNPGTHEYLRSVGVWQSYIKNKIRGE